MSRSRCTPSFAPSCLIVFVAAWLVTTTAALAFAQAQPEAAIPNQITQAIDPDERVTLQNNVHPLAQARYDQGPASGSRATGRIMLVLKRSDMQEHALRQYLDELQNPNSANYHKWLTPETLGAQYGISADDLATVTAWLQAQGFVIDKVSSARNMIVFSGNVAQIQQAFSTTIHRYVVNGETHFANASDPQIPAALAPVIAAVAPLNDFRPRAGAVKAGTAHYDAGSKMIRPDITLCDMNNKCDILFAVPADAASIYDTPNSTLNANYSKISSIVGGKSYDGTGVTIGVVGDANIVAQDVKNYRAAFLPSSYSANQPDVIIDENDPGVNPDSTEALLDLQVAGGIAPGAKINFYTSADDGLASGLILAIYRSITDNNVSILNVSFGSCEAFLGSGGNESLAQLWEQAAAQGITVAVATGDSGSAGCDNDNESTSAQFGLAVSGFASTPFNIAVGGTDYDVLTQEFNTYVKGSNSAANFYGTALSYIPENPWNDSTSVNTGSYTLNQPTMIEGQTNIVGAGGGVSSCTQSSGQEPLVTCTPNSGYPTPAFQMGTTGFTFGNRTIPDVSFLAANGLYNVAWLICSDSQTQGMTATPTQMDCQQSGGQFTTSTTFTGEGGTSAAAPAFAGMLALVSQAQGGARLGQANRVLYNLAAQSGLYATVFHDVTAGNNSVVCTAGSPNCAATNNFISDYNATANYDATSGLGSVDAAQLVANWTKASFTPTTAAFTINGATMPVNVKHGTQLDLAASISPGAATGDVSFINDSGVSANQSTLGDFQTISGGKVDLTTGDLPGSPTPYNVYAYYGGDVKNAASLSNAVEVTISPESSSVLLALAFSDPTSGAPICSDIVQGSPTCKGVSVPYGTETVISAQVKSTSGSNTPATGKIAFADTAGTLPTASVPISSLGTASITNADFPDQTLAVGSHGLTASFAGDGSYLASNSGGAYPFTIKQGTTNVSVTGTQSANSVTITANVNTDSIGQPPTGDVVFRVGSATIGSVPAYTNVGFSPLGPIVAQYALTVPASTTGFANGDNTVNATYAGDKNYTASMGSGTVTVTGGGSGFTITAPTSLGVVAGVATANTGTVGVMSSSGYFSGTVALTCAISSGPTGGTSAPTCALSPASVTVSGTSIVPSTLTISTTATTTLGAYVVTVTGTGGGTTASATTNLTVSSSNGLGSFSVSGTAVSVKAGAIAGNASSVSITPSGGFLGSVGLKCALTSSPMGAVNLPTCSIPASVLVTGTSAATATMTVSSTAATSGALSYPALFRGAGEMALACLVMLAIPARRRAWRRFLGLVALAFAVSGVLACGGGGGNHGGGGTTTGSYTFTVTGTASSSGSGGASSITASSSVQVMID